MSVPEIPDLTVIREGTRIVAVLANGTELRGTVTDVRHEGGSVNLTVEQVKLDPVLTDWFLREPAP